MPKIVVSSVHGSAAGAGMSLAFVADLCVAAEDARFTPAYGKIGASPDGGGTVGVVPTVGVRRALQIFLAEDSFSAAASSLTWGLVATVVPAAGIESGDARNSAQRLAQNTPAALGGNLTHFTGQPFHADQAATRCRERRSSAACTPRIFTSR